jgi:hypothetical protein
MDNALLVAGFHIPYVAEPYPAASAVNRHKNFIAQLLKMLRRPFNQRQYLRLIQRFTKIPVRLDLVAESGVVGAAGSKRNPNVGIGFPDFAGGLNAVGFIARNRIVEVYVKKRKLKRAGLEYRQERLCAVESVDIG